MNRTLVVTPCRVEFESSFNFIRDKGYEYNHVKEDDLEVIQVESEGISLAMGGHGKVNFAIKSQAYIHLLSEIDLFICAGAAGGLSNKVNIHDILICEETIEHDYIERFDPQPPPTFSICGNFLLKAKERLGNDVKFGKIASGDEDVACRKRAEEILNKFDVDAVAWEGAGGAKVAHHFNIPFVEIRGISDVADSDAPVIFSNNVKVVMPKIMEAIFTLKS